MTTTTLTLICTVISFLCLWFCDTLTLDSSFNSMPKYRCTYQCRGGSNTKIKGLRKSVIDVVNIEKKEKRIWLNELTSISLVYP